MLDGVSAEGKYQCSRQRVIVINLMGLFIASMFSSFSSDSTSNPTAGGFIIFLSMSLIFLVSLVVSLYKGKSISRSGIENIKDHYYSVTVGQLILSHLFYLTLIMGFKSFF